MQRQRAWAGRIERRSRGDIMHHGRRAPGQAMAREGEEAEMDEDKDEQLPQLSGHEAQLP